MNELFWIINYLISLIGSVSFGYLMLRFSMPDIRTVEKSLKLGVAGFTGIIIFAASFAASTFTHPMAVLLFIPIITLILSFFFMVKNAVFVKPIIRIAIPVLKVQPTPVATPKPAPEPKKPREEEYEITRPSVIVSRGYGQPAAVEIQPEKELKEFLSSREISEKKRELDKKERELNEERKRRANLESRIRELENEIKGIKEKEGRQALLEEKRKTTAERAQSLVDEKMKEEELEEKQRMLEEELDKIKRFQSEKESAEQQREDQEKTQEKTKEKAFEEKQRMFQEELEKIRREQSEKDLIEQQKKALEKMEERYAETHAEIIPAPGTEIEEEEPEEIIAEEEPSAREIKNEVLKEALLEERIIKTPLLEEKIVTIEGRKAKPRPTPEMPVIVPIETPRVSVLSKLIFGEKPPKPPIEMMIEDAKKRAEQAVDVKEEADQKLRKAKPADKKEVKQEVEKAERDVQKAHGRERYLMRRKDIIEEAKQDITTHEMTRGKTQAKRENVELVFPDQEGATEGLDLGDLESIGSLDELGEAGLENIESLDISLETLGGVSTAETVQKQPGMKGCPNCLAKGTMIVYCPYCGKGLCANCADSVQRKEQMIVYSCPHCKKEVIVKQ